MPISPFMAAINQICDEKGLSPDTVLETIEAAVAAAYRKDYGRPSQNIRAKFDPETGQTKIWQVFDVVEEVEDDQNQKTVDEAKKIKKNAKLEDQVEIELEPHSDFGRIAAQTAKQVIIQRIREAERDMLYKEFKEKENQIINGVVQQIEGSTVIIDLGKLNGLILPSEQISTEKYYSGQRLKVFVAGVEETGRGPQVLVSRTNPNLIKGLFETEVPEISAGTVQIINIAREAGSRSKVSVHTEEEGLDPIGSCVGQRGTRIQAVLAEIGEEKIDIILFDKDDSKYITNALSPAKIEKVKLSKDEKKATVDVNEDQLSLAIGKGGQNVRLASKLTGWSINIEPARQSQAPDVAGGKAEDKKDAEEIEDIKDVEVTKDVKETKKEAKDKKVKKVKKTVKKKTKAEVEKVEDVAKKPAKKKTTKK